jgi:alkanesulfonate monooxygenase SsuD/methylene tetrahydromethanopterin reductase-like flavin-dependent oxidoreductase (luciferase family)
MIAARTSRVGLFPDVACLPLRPPAVLAKAAASLDVLSGGRVELGLGAGAFWDAVAGYVGRRGPGESLAALAEAIQVIRQVWSGERNLRFEGEYHRVADGWIPSLQGELPRRREMSERLDALIAEAGNDARAGPGWSRQRHSGGPRQGPPLQGRGSTHLLFQALVGDELEQQPPT